MPIDKAEFTQRLYKACTPSQIHNPLFYIANHACHIKTDWTVYKLAFCNRERILIFLKVLTCLILSGAAVCCPRDQKCWLTLLHSGFCFSMLKMVPLQLAEFTFDRKMRLELKKCRQIRSPKAETLATLLAHEVRWILIKKWLDFKPMHASSFPLNK